MRLWRGEIPLSRAFWEYAIVYGSLLNLITTIAALALVTLEEPALAVAAFFLPLPYNVLAVVGVWRSAAAYEGPRARADLARVAVILWAVVATIA
jgi:hypothetical protein